jgi:Heavy metal binding domain
MRREQEETWYPGVKMKFLRFRILPLLVAATLLGTGVSSYSIAVNAAQKELSAHSKPARFHYVCPMHEGVTSKKPGFCPKCKMKLVRKPVPPKPSV